MYLSPVHTCLSSISPNNGVFIFYNTALLFSKDFSIYYFT